jgi:hypothetical protein
VNSDTRGDVIRLLDGESASCRLAPTTPFVTNCRWTYQNFALFEIL